METLREKVTEIVLLTRQDAVMNSGKGGGSSGIAIEAILALVHKEQQSSHLKGMTEGLAEGRLDAIKELKKKRV